MSNVHSYPSYPQLHFTLVLTPGGIGGYNKYMKRTKKQIEKVGKYNRDAFRLVKRWQVCQALAVSYNKSKYSDEQLILLKEDLDRQNLL